MKQLTDLDLFKILVIDDDKDVCDFMTDFLQEEGYYVRAITKPKKALTEIRTNHYHLVILDLVMPEIDGIHILKEIRKFDDDAIVIILTGYPSVDSAVESMKYNVFDYIKKPIIIEEFLKVITKAAEEKGIVLDASKQIYNEIGSQLKNLRKRKNFTLRELAAKTNISISMISAIERGQSSASVLTLYKIAKALDSSLSELFKNFK
jgi:DNA-binding NtrC family response regulator